MINNLLTSILDNPIPIFIVISIATTIISLFVNNLKSVICGISLLIEIVYAFYFFAILPFSLMFWPVILPFLLVLTTLLLNFSKNKNLDKKTLKKFTVFMYIVTMFFFILAFEICYSSLVYSGIYVVLLLILLRLLTRELYRQWLFYGVLDLLTGLVLVAIILTKNFGLAEFSGEYEDIRKSLTLLGFAMMFEGVLMICRKRINKVLCGNNSSLN